MKVLYLEDNPGDADLTRRALRKADPETVIEVVGTVAGALARIDEVEAAVDRGEPSPFDLVLLDMNLPDGSGLGVISRIRHLSLPLSAVVLTGSGDEESVLTALRAGADDYVAKRPEYWTRLHPVLASALENSRSKAKLRERPIRLLYAEPNAVDVQLMRRHLAAQAPFIQVETVATGAEALDRLARPGPSGEVDVLLLDYRLPDMNALELLKEIHQVRKLDVPAIVHTGMGSEDVALEALKLGAADYLVKSAGYLDRLSLVVEKAFYRSRAERERKALRESEMRLRAIIETDPECVLVLDPDGRITEVNPAGVAMFEADSAKDLIGRPFNGIVLPGYAEAFRELFRKVMAGSHGILEFRVRGLKGTERWVDTHAAAMPDADGKIAYFLGITRDITERKRSEERMQQTEKMNAFGQLAGGVAHDFNNQLGAILGYAEMLADRIDDPELRRFAASIEKAAKRSAELTHNLLTFARQAPSRSIPVDVHLLIVETSELLERTIDKRIIVSSMLAARPATILGDPSQIQNALLNLALNARDAMSEGGTLHFSTETINIGLSEVSGFNADLLPLADVGVLLSEGTYLHVSISDTGTGMTDEVKKRIFEPFFTTKPVGKGTGMGLASVFGTVKLHHGAITLTSAQGHGTTFHLYFPISDQEVDGSLGTPGAKRDIGRLNILVVDDEPMLRELLADLLIQEGHSVYTASNGREAVKIFRETSAKINLVVLDMIMPDLGGRETYRALRDIRPDVKVLLSSGYTPKEEIQGILDEGILGVLHKPYTKGLLEESIRSVMEKAVRSSKSSNPA
jgi:two-component system cell cycle sensor histidine kinase/response regulator CckA